jgi:DNA end-binding protein Ku
MAKSNIAFGLVNIPITLNPIIKDNDTSFNQLHKKCLNRIKYIKFCPHCKLELKEKDIVKGYSYKKDDYLVFEKKELDALKCANNDLIDVISFIPFEEIPPVYFEKSYFINPDNKSKAYNLFYEALKKTKLVALAKTVITSKFYYCILRIETEGIIMTTLYFPEEIIIPDTTINTKVDNKELDLAVKLINNMKTKFDPSILKDEYQDNIKKAINNKLKGKKINKPKKSNKVQINNLMEALERSLQK